MPKLFVIRGLLSRGASRGESSGMGMLELIPIRWQTKKTAAIPNMEVAIIHGLFDMIVFFRILPVYDAAPLNMTSKIRSSIQAQVITLLEALSQVQDPQSRRFAEILKQGNLSVERFSPYAEAVEPHTRDVAYMVVQGTGVFIMGEKRINFETGDFLFTPA